MINIDKDKDIDLDWVAYKKSGELDVIPENDKGQPHGYWTVFHRGDILFEGNYVNNVEQGLWKEYWHTEGKLSEKIFHIS